MRIWIALAALAMAGTAVAQPETTAPSAPPAEAARSAVADDDVGTAAPDRRYDPMRVVCRRSRPSTGTRVVRSRGDTRVCQTMAEWDRASELGQEVLKERDKGLCGPGGCEFGPFGK